MEIDLKTQQKIEEKLKKRLEEEQEKLKRNKEELKEEKRQNLLLEHNICPKCGGDAKQIFYWRNFLLGAFASMSYYKKMKCLNCGFTKVIQEDNLY